MVIMMGGNKRCEWSQPRSSLDHDVLAAVERIELTSSVYNNDCMLLCCIWATAAIHRNRQNSSQRSPVLRQSLVFTPHLYPRPSPPTSSAGSWATSTAICRPWSTLDAVSMGSTAQRPRHCPWGSGYPVRTFRTSSSAAHHHYPTCSIHSHIAPAAGPQDIPGQPHRTHKHRR